MASPKPIVLFSLVVAAAFTESCCYSEPVCPQKCPKAADQPWYLTCVEIDRSNLHNTGSLPMYRKDDRAGFGQDPVAFGTMQASREGLWSISVRFRESVVG